MFAKPAQLARFALIAIIGGSIGYSLPAPERGPRFEIEARTDSGLIYVAGRGSTCNAAWQNAVIPHNWNHVVCVAAQ